jgi:hypothetical protein
VESAIDLNVSHRSTSNGIDEAHCTRDLIHTGYISMLQLEKIERYLAGK